MLEAEAVLDRRQSRVIVSLAQDHCGIESGVVAGLPKV